MSDIDAKWPETTSVTSKCYILKDCQNWLRNCFQRSAHQHLVRITVFLSSNDPIFLLLLEIMICEVFKPSGILQH